MSDTTYDINDLSRMSPEEVYGHEYEYSEIDGDEMAEDVIPAAAGPTVDTDEMSF